MHIKIKAFLILILFLCLTWGCGDEGVLLDGLAPTAPAALPDVGPVPINIQDIIWGKDVDTLMAELEDTIEGDNDPDDIRAKALIHQICLRREQEAYYTKYVSAGGVAIMGNGLIDDRLFYVARDIVLGMTFKRPELRELLTPTRENRPGATQHCCRHDVTGRTTPSPKFRMILVNAHQGRTVIPEIHLGNGAIDYPIVTIGGLGSSYGWANVYVVPGFNSGFEIFIHEFAHAIHIAIELLDTTFDARLKAAFQSARETGSSLGSYALTTKGEYWAEGVKHWFLWFSLEEKAHALDLFREREPLMYTLLAEWFDPINLRAVESRKYE